MLDPHKVNTLIIELLVTVKLQMVIIKLLHSDLFPVIEHSLSSHILLIQLHGFDFCSLKCINYLVNYSIPAITNYAILGEVICSVFQKMECEIPWCLAHML